MDDATDAALAARWWRHLQQVRWFGGKGADGSVVGLNALGWYTAPGAWPAVRSEVATLSFADGHQECYHLLVAYSPAGTAPAGAIGDTDVSGLGRVVAADATEDPAAVRAFVEALQRAPGEHMDWFAVLPDAAGLDVHVHRGEQSNTTLVLGGAALFKLFRKIEPGPNLDAEVLGALAGTAAATPALYGRLVGRWPTGSVTDLGMVVERVADARDGWELATAACAAETSFAAEASALGWALRAVHEAMAAAFGTGSRPGDEIAARMLARLDAAVAQAPVLAPDRDALAARLVVLRGTPVSVQRVHGDFHLGQTLRSPSGWTIIDFEGEPAKTAAERREPDAVWRDVAGMLRSFDYARSAHDEPGSPAAEIWARSSREAFLTGYCDSEDVRADVLAAYEVDKAVYEMVYELRNRPDWVGIPLGAIRHHAR